MPPPPSSRGNPCENLNGAGSSPRPCAPSYFSCSAGAVDEVQNSRSGRPILRGGGARGPFEKSKTVGGVAGCQNHAKGLILMRKGALLSHIRFSFCTDATLHIKANILPCSILCEGTFRQSPKIVSIEIVCNDCIVAGGFLRSGPACARSSFGMHGR